MSEETQPKSAYQKGELKTKLDKLFALSDAWLATSEFRVPPKIRVLEIALKIYKRASVVNGMLDLESCRPTWPVTRVTKQHHAAIADINDYIVTPYTYSDELEELNKTVLQASAMAKIEAVSSRSAPAAKKPELSAAKNAGKKDNFTFPEIIELAANSPEFTRTVPCLVESIVNSLWVVSAYNIARERNIPDAECERLFKERSVTADRFSKHLFNGIDAFKKDMGLEIHRKIASQERFDEALSLARLTATAEEKLNAASKAFCREVDELERAKGKESHIYDRIMEIENYVRAEFKGTFQPHEFHMSEAHITRNAKKSAHHEEMERSRQRLVDEATRRTEEAAAAETARKESHQPFLLPPSTAHVIGRLENVPEANASSALAASLAATVLAISGKQAAPPAPGALPKLDLRGKSIELLAKMLLADSNVVSAARSLGLGKDLDALKIYTPTNTSAAQLRSIYTSSPDVRKMSSALLKDDMGLLLLAPLIRGEDRSKKYGAAVVKYTGELKALSAQIAKFESKGLSSQDLIDFHDDPEVKQFLELQKSYQEKQAGLSSMRSGFAVEVQQALEGKIRREITMANIPEVVSSLPSLPSALPIPKELELALAEEKSGLRTLPSPRGNKFMLVCSDDDAGEICREIKRDASPKNVQETVKFIRTECSYRQANETKISELCQQFGFEHITKNDGTGNENLLLHHQEYGSQKESRESHLTVPLSGGTQEERAIALIRAEEQFHEIQLTQRSVLKMAQKAGVSVEGVDAQFNASGPVVLSYGGESRTLAPRGYFSKYDFTVAESLIQKARLHQQHADAPLLESDAESAQKTRAIWQPGKDQTLIILDTGTLHKLAAERPAPANGKKSKTYTWLDIIKLTAELPNVKIIIPAVVADWELQRKIPKPGADMSKDAEDFVQIDPHRYTGVPSGKNTSVDMLKDSAGKIREFLKSASRARIVDGKAGKEVQIDENANKNIIIMETQGDEALYDRIRKAETEPSIHRRIQDYKDNIDGKGEGEQAINRILKELPFNLPAMVVSDDNRYFRENAPPVGQVGTGTYLNAEILTRGEYLKRRLGLEDDLYLHNLMSDIEEHWAKYKSITRDEVTGEHVALPVTSFFSDRDRCGAPAHSGHQPEYMDELIARGHEEARHAAPAAANGKHTNGKHTNGTSSTAKSWVALTEGAQRKPADPLSLDPLDLRARKHTGWNLSSGM